jgi:hypothetical protein
VHDTRQQERSGKHKSDYSGDQRSSREQETEITIEVHYGQRQENPVTARSLTASSVSKEFRENPETLERAIPL